MVLAREPPLWDVLSQVGVQIKVMVSLMGAAFHAPIRAVQMLALAKTYKVPGEKNGLAQDNKTGRNNGR